MYENDPVQALHGPLCLDVCEKELKKDAGHWLFTVLRPALERIFHLYGDVAIAGEGLQNLSLCSALRTLEQGGIFIVPHLL
jgi:hypothetical protein